MCWRNNKEINPREEENDKLSQVKKDKNISTTAMPAYLKQWSFPG